MATTKKASTAKAGQTAAKAPAKPPPKPSPTLPVLATTADVLLGTHLQPDGTMEIILYPSAAHLRRVLYSLFDYKWQCVYRPLRNETSCELSFKYGGEWIKKSGGGQTKSEAFIDACKVWRILPEVIPSFRCNIGKAPAGGFTLAALEHDADGRISAVTVKDGEGEYTWRNS